MNTGNDFCSIGCLNDHAVPINTFQTHFDKPTCGKHHNTSHLKCQQHTSVCRSVLRKYKKLYAYFNARCYKYNFRCSWAMSQFEEIFKAIIYMAFS